MASSSVDVGYSIVHGMVKIGADRNAAVPSAVVVAVPPDDAGMTPKLVSWVLDEIQVVTPVAEIADTMPALAQAEAPP
jgi:hypothetical protein